MTMVTGLRRIATYERVSSEDQRERETIKTQRDALDRRLASEPDVALVDRYVDEAVSGSKGVAERSDGGRLLRDAEAGRFNELWVYAWIGSGVISWTWRSSAAGSAISGSAS
jgi:site-specific DNA recombinase